MRKVVLMLIVIMIVISYLVGYKFSTYDTMQVIREDELNEIIERRKEIDELFSGDNDSYDHNGINCLFN